MNDITSILVEEVERFLMEYKLQKPIEINAGHCKAFSVRINKRLPQAQIVHVDQVYEMPTMYAIDFVNFRNVGKWNHKKVARYNNGDSTIPSVFDKLIMTPFHQWILYKGKHYDAEEVNGVESFFELPYFQDYIQAEQNPKSTLIERSNQESLQRIIGI